MRVDRRTALQLILATSSAVLFTGQAFALEREKNGFYLTGTGVRVKKKGPFTGKVYSISHYMRELPPAKTKEAVIAMETDKVFSWRMLRDVDAEKIHEALNEGFAKNGYADRTKIDTALRAFTKELKEGTNVQLTYAAGPKTTTIKVEGDGTATIPGSDFMRGTWSIWFGNFDQPALSEALISRIPDTPKAGG